MNVYISTCLKTIIRMCYQYPMLIFFYCFAFLDSRYAPFFNKSEEDYTLKRISLQKEK